MEIPQGYLEQFKQKQKGAGDERAAVIDGMYLIYASEKNLRDRENWKRYRLWLRSENHPNTPQMRDRFKHDTARKKGGYIEEKDKKGFAIFLSPFKGDAGLSTLYYCKSVMMDLHKTGKNASAWLFSSVTKKCG